MTDQEPEVERLRQLLLQASHHLEFAQDFMDSGPGTEREVTEINRLLGAIS